MYAARDLDRSSNSFDARSCAQFSFTAEDAKGTEYSASFEIREDVKSSECKHDVKGNEIFVVRPADKHFSSMCMT